MGTRRSKGFTLLAAVILTVFMAGLGMAAFFQAYSYQQNILSRQAESEALYLAQNVAERIVEEARLGANWSLASVEATPVFTLPSEYKKPDGTAAELTDADGGSYTVRLWPQQSLLTTTGVHWVMLYFSVTAQSRTIMPSGSRISRSVDIAVKAQSPLRFFMTTSTQFNVVDGATINGDIMGPIINVRDGINAPIQINGGIYYSRQISIGAQQNSRAYAAPGGYHNGNVNVSGAIAPQKNVTFVSIDLSDENNRYRVLADADGYYAASSFTIPETLGRNIDLNGTNTRAANGVVYADGDIYVGPCVYNEAMTLVARGDIHIRGSLTSIQGAQLGLFAQGSIIIDAVEGTRDLDLQNIFGMANGVIRTEAGMPPGTFQSIEITGSLALKGQDTEQGTVAANLSSYGARTYTQNPNPYLKPPPGMPYIADIVEWSLRGDPAAAP